MRIGRRAMWLFPCADAGGGEVWQEIREETNDKKGDRCRRAHLRTARCMERLHREAPSRPGHPGRTRLRRARLDLDQRRAAAQPAAGGGLRAVGHGRSRQRAELGRHPARFLRRRCARPGAGRRGHRARPALSVSLPAGRRHRGPGGRGRGVPWLQRVDRRHVPRRPRQAFGRRHRANAKCRGRGARSRPYCPARPEGRLLPPRALQGSRPLRRLAAAVLAGRRGQRTVRRRPWQLRLADAELRHQPLRQSLLQPHDLPSLRADGCLPRHPRGRRARTPSGPAGRIPRIRG